MDVVERGFRDGGETYIVSLDAESDVLAELALVRVLVLLLEGAHVVGDVLTEDVGAVNLGVEALVLGAVAREALHGVRDVEATVDGALHGTEDASSGGGAGQTNVQVATERSRTVIGLLDQVLLAGHIGTTSVQRVQAELLQDAAGNQQTGAVSGSIVGQTNLEQNEKKFNQLLFVYIPPEVLP